MATEVPVWLAGAGCQKEQKAPFARALWLHGINNGAGLNGYSLGLSNLSARGVRVASEASTAQTYKSVARKFGYESPEAMRKDLQALAEVKQIIK